MSKAENIEIFCDINSYEEFSNYSKDLNKVYGNKSFKNFFINLKTYKPISITNHEFSTENTKRQYRKNEPFNSNLFEKILNSNDNIKSSHFMKPTIMQPTSNACYRTLNNIKKKKRLHLFQLQNITSFGKYDPNYNSIKAKIPSIDFSKELPRPGFEDIQERDKMLFSERKLFKSQQHLPYLAKSLSMENIPKSFTNNNLITSDRSDDYTSFSIKKKKNTNHALKFSQYTWRKDFAPQYNNNSCDRGNTSLSLDKHIKSVVDFSKMKGSNHNTFAYHPLNGPSIGMYNPKYEAILKKSPEILFCRKKTKMKLNKKYLLKKMWSNYEVTKDYQLVNF